ERFSYIKIKGLMTMGPFVDNPEKLRPLFRETKKLFDRIRDMGIKNADMEILSMGMSDSFLIAVEEGANMVRIGTAIFGKRPY
ncbi:YggS family pyridoxal phosphate-dependent enzyme, partial [bacterium]